MSENIPLFDIVQLYNGTQVKVNRERDTLLTTEAKKLLQENCLMPNALYQDFFAHVAMSYADNSAHAQRLYDYMSQLWFLPAWEMLIKGSMPITAFINEAEDNLPSIIDIWNEAVWISSRKNSVASYWGNIRANVTSFIQAQEAMTVAVRRKNQFSNNSVYINISHPEIEEFLHYSKSSNLSLGILISDAFMRAVEKDEEWFLISPKDELIQKTVNARKLWSDILNARLDKEKDINLLFIDNINRAMVEHHKLAGLNIKAASACGGAILPSGKDQYGQSRSAVVCGASVNLAKFEEWENLPQFIEDIMRFLDNVLSFFVKSAPDTLMRAKYSAMRERSISLGVMGFASLLQAKQITFDSVNAKMWNKRIFKYLHEEVGKASIKLAGEKGACPDAEDYGAIERFSYKLAILDTENISKLAGGISNAVEPVDYNIDQMCLIEMAAARVEFICQSQMLNLYLNNNIDKDYIHILHYMAWKSGVKSLHNCLLLND